MQTILGSGGAIGRELAKVLPEYTEAVRLVSRDPEPVTGNEQLFPADLLHEEAVRRAVDGADIAYLTVGLPYDHTVWQRDWPKIMNNVIKACKSHNCRLVFFDNIYMYDPGVMGNITEEAPVNPSSKKGAVRAEIAHMLMAEVEQGSLQALIARSPDFYGPGIDDTSILNVTVTDNLAKGKKANWMGSADCKHSFAYTPDAGRATALLGNTPDAYGQVWHLPTAGNPPTGREWVHMIADELGVDPKFREVPKWMIHLIGLFDTTMAELGEMMYQYDRDYIFNSSKFEKRFELEPTPYEEGVKAMVAALPVT